MRNIAGVFAHRFALEFQGCSIERINIDSVVMRTDGQSSIIGTELNI